MKQKYSVPPKELLDKIEEIARLKETLSMKERSLTSANGLYVQSGSLPGYGKQYMAGSGKLIPSLVFVKKPDGSMEIEKYQLGDWQKKVDETLQLCLRLAHLASAEQLGTGENAVYVFGENIISDVIKEVMECSQQHSKEINEQYQRKLSGFSVRLAFLNELKEKWLQEHVELTNPGVSEMGVDELLGETETYAWVFGYMAGKHWISTQKLLDANQALGELIARAVRDNRKDGKSRGVAFAAAFGCISAIGTTHASMTK